MDRLEPQPLVLQNLALLERVVRLQGTRVGFDVDELDDALSWIKERLIENDYAIIRKWRGESQITTYLTVVVTRLFQDYQTATRGRWRPSSIAKRMGPLALRLEKLIYYDGYSIAEAIEILRLSDPDLPEERELHRLAALLPERVSGQHRTSTIDPAILPGDDTADHGILDDENDQLRATLRHTLERALESLNPEDSVVVRMRMLEGFSVADIARVLGVEQKVLYRRLERILLHLRGELENAGVTRSDVASLIEGER